MLIGFHLTVMGGGVIAGPFCHLNPHTFDRKSQLRTSKCGWDRRDVRAVYHIVMGARTVAVVVEDLPSVNSVAELN